MCMESNVLLVTILFSVALVAVAFVGLAVRVLFKKGGKFSKRCASIDIGDGKIVGGCDGCGDKKHSQCPHFEKHHGFESMPAEQIREAIEDK